MSSLAPIFESHRHQPEVVKISKAYAAAMGCLSEAQMCRCDAATLSKDHLATTTATRSGTACCSW